MSTTGELHSQLGALEEQIERLSQLKSLIERLKATEDAASSAAESAEKATRANKQIVDSFDEVAQRIEQSDAAGQLENLEEEIGRLKEVRQKVKEDLNSLNGQLETVLGDHRSAMMRRLTEELDEQSSTLDEQLEQQAASLEDGLEDQKEVLGQLRETFEKQKTEIESEVEEQSSALKDQVQASATTLGNKLDDQHGALDRLQKLLEKHRSEIKSRLEEQSSALKDQVQALSATLSDKLEDQGEDLSRLQELLREHREKQKGRMTTLKGEVQQVQSVLQEAELVSRLERITDTSKSASQAAQNSLSRIDAVERNLSQSISQNHERREDAEEQTQDTIAALKTQVYGHIALSIGILAVLLLEVFGMI